jgi:parallel beta-helix repeat protein
MMKKVSVCIIIALALGIIFVPNLSAFKFENLSYKMLIQNYNGKTIYVGGNGPGNYSKIQDAIDNASGGDSIFVFHGLYYENVSISKQLYIRGEGKKITIIDAQKKGYTVNISANGVTISGFTIQNGSYSSSMVNEANLFIFSCDNIITENIFMYSESGIMLHNANGNIISENIMSYNDIGLWISGSKNIVTRNFITNNSEMGIDIFGSENLISGNIITNNKGTGLYFVDSSKNNITDNEISKNSMGIILTWNRENDENRDNLILRNNLRNNTKRNAGFAEHNGFVGKNIWKNNYWEKNRIFPKLILGIKQTRFYYPTPFGALWFFIPWFHFDWHPARQPYNISIQN